MGRPKGLPKTGGRKPGTPNKSTATTRERIEQDADPLGFLTRLMRGEEIDGRRATLEHRAEVALKLLNKVAPDMKAVELTGDAGAPVTLIHSPDDAERVRSRLLERLERLAPANAVERPAVH